MANLDDAKKRGSGMNVASPWRSLWPFPDGDLSPKGDHQHMAFMYSGLEASAPAVPTGGIPPVRPIYKLVPLSIRRAV